MRSCKTLFASILLLGTSSSLVLGACDVAGLEGKDDGAWLVSLNGSWQPMDRLNAALSDGRPRDLNFAYVARDAALTIYRRGILVIKTGFRASAKGGDRVTLAREAYQRDRVETCESYPSFPGGSVRGKSYDDYHDYSYSVDGADRTLLTSFHVTYAGRTRGCKASNDDNSDSYFTGRWQSNRSQFSFDESVVANGQHSQFLAQFGATPAYASTASARKVEIKRYTADSNGFACVTFTASMGPGSFIRINDLERRIGLLRADEQRWEWPR